MEIQRLDLLAFGPFTERTLMFGRAAGRLHIVYGPNEAGKSSALRGLKALLYSIDERTADDFIHAKDKLRIAGCVRAANGAELVFTRRKGRKHTLLSPEGESLDDSALTPFLQGVSRELFESLFGIDHWALVQGGQEILEQKGEVGQALFSASLGSHKVRGVLKELDEEADRLFRPRGATRILNAALKEYTEVNKKLREQSLSSRQWEEHRRALAGAAAKLTHVEAELAESRAELTRLKRLQQLLPKLARRRELRQKIAALGDVVLLAEDFRERRLKVVAEQQRAWTLLQKSMAQRHNLRAQLERICVSPAVLEQGESIEDLHARRGSYCKAVQERPQLEAEYRQLLTDSKALLKEVRPDLAPKDMEALRPLLARKSRLTELGHQNSALVDRVRKAQNMLREAEARLEKARQARRQLPDVGSPEGLRRAVAAARKVGDIDQTIQTARLQTMALHEQGAADLAGLTLWDGPLEALSRLPLPSRESIQRFDERYAELENQGRRLREKQEEIAEAKRDAARRLDEIQRAGTVPTEAELVALRDERERAWRLLRRRWLEGEDVVAEARALDGERALPEAFEHRVRCTDQLADRLWREAERVHRQASLLAKLEHETRRAEVIVRRLEEWTAHQSQVEAEWVALWNPCAIQPRMPREMRAWLDKVERLRERVVQLSTLRQQLSDLEHTRDRHIASLKRQLQSLGKDNLELDSLEVLLLECEQVVERLDATHRQHEKLVQEINTLERNVDSGSAEYQAARRDLEAWRAQWRQAVEGLGLEEDALPAEAAEAFEKIQQLFVNQRAAEKLRNRLQAISEEVETFRDQVGRTIAHLAPELMGHPPEEAVLHLNALLGESRIQQSQRRQIEEHLQQVQQEIQEAEATFQTMTTHLEVLCREAQRSTPAELDEAERRSGEYRDLQTEIGRVEQEIVAGGEGATLEELEAEAKAMDPDTLPYQIEALTDKIDHVLEPKRKELAEIKIREEVELERMDGSDAAAALASQSQIILAGIRAGAERYVRLKLAAKILRDEIERYRRENQGPLVRHASEYFAELTRGSFAGLRADFNERDEPVLVGFRPNQAQVPVEGMSSGTRDQLYLALRLASLEKYMENAEPMPFIVDDILVDFDDQRSQAALQALAALAAKTQVILFTHHSRVVEQAKSLRDSAQVHEL